LSKRSGAIEGRPVSAYNGSTSPAIDPSTASALALIERSGCWAGTRDSGEK
jgi:hypothetical protein